MWETAAFVAGGLLIVAGILSIIFPLRWIGVRTRACGFIVIAAGFLVVAIGAQMVDSYLVYLGLALAFLGAVSLIRPLGFLFIRTRWIALLVLVIGLLLAGGTALFPSGEKHAGPATSKLDHWMPRWQVGEKHTIEIAAPPDKV